MKILRIKIQFIQPELFKSSTETQEDTATKKNEK